MVQDVGSHLIELRSLRSRNQFRSKPLHVGRNVSEVSIQDQRQALRSTESSFEDQGRRLIQSAKANDDEQAEHDSEPDRHVQEDPRSDTDPIRAATTIRLAGRLGREREALGGLALYNLDASAPRRGMTR